MSDKFEEIVLKKLNNIDSTMQDVVLKKLEKLDKLEDKTNGTEKLLQEVVLKKLDDLDSTMQDVVLKKLDNLEKEMSDLKFEVKDTQEVVNYLNNNFTKFDYEINKKVDTLFDAYTSCKETDTTHAQNIVSLNAKTFNHDIRISNLENQVLAV